jgi:hypothetical protein
MRGQVFDRARLMMAAIAAAMSANPTPGLAQKAALDAIGPYESRGKGGKRPHRSVGTKAYRRAAIKTRQRRIA